MKFTSIIDLILTPLFLILIFMGLIVMKKRFIKDETDKYFIMKGFLLKIIGGFTAGFIYIFYYNGGDTTYYFDAIKSLTHYLYSNPFDIVHIFASPKLLRTENFEILKLVNQNAYLGDVPTFTVVKICTFFNFFCFDSFFAIITLCALFSFYCSWKFYIALGELYPDLKKKFGFAIFYMPSAIFWGSGIFKDTFTLGAIFLLIYSFIYIFILRKFKLTYLLSLIISLYLLKNIRSFFLITILPFLVFWVFQHNYNRIKNFGLKIVLAPIFILILTGFVVVGTQLLNNYFVELDAEKFQDKLIGFQGWHTTLKGSAYNLGEMEYTTLGYLKKFPAAVNVTFFRPYITEVNKPIIFLSFLQGLFFTIFTIYIIFRYNFVRFFAQLSKSYDAIALLGFSLFFGFITGLTSYNFGALDRYKIPCLSTYIISLLIVEYRMKINRSPIIKEKETF
jgi:hypothetical protein